jgi:putative peptidoglycan lipid II flippase
VLGPLLAQPGALRWAALAGLIAIGLAVYGAAAMALGALRPAELLRTLRRPPS